MDLKLTAFCCGFLMMPAAAAALPQTAAVHVPPAATRASSRVGGPKLCFDQIFYWAMPGKVNYCLGLKNLRHGHYRNGMELLKLAAGWGNKYAQYTLGLIYYSGHHVTADPALGLAWLKLANERHDDAQIGLATRSAIKWATPDQRQRADHLYQQMRRKYGDKVATARAWHHLQHWKLSHGPMASGCLVLYGAYAYAARMHGLDPGLPSISTMHVGARSVNSWQGSCVPVQVQRHLVQKSADVYFRGWAGTVTVEPLQQVPASAASSGH